MSRAGLREWSPELSCVFCPITPNRTPYIIFQITLQAPRGHPTAKKKHSAALPWPPCKYPALYSAGTQQAAQQHPALGGRLATNTFFVTCDPPLHTGKAPNTFGKITPQGTCSPSPLAPPTLCTRTCGHPPGTKTTLCKHPTVSPRALHKHSADTEQVAEKHLTPFFRCAKTLCFCYPLFLVSLARFSFRCFFKGMHRIFFVMFVQNRTMMSTIVMVTREQQW